jgi:hypothetical protein
MCGCSHESRTVNMRDNGLYMAGRGLKDRRSRLEVEFVVFIISGKICKGNGRFDQLGLLNASRPAFRHCYGWSRSVSRTTPRHKRSNYNLIARTIIPSFGNHSGTYLLPRKSYESAHAPLSKCAFGTTCCIHARWQRNYMYSTLKRAMSLA